MTAVLTVAAVMFAVALTWPSRIPEGKSVAEIQQRIGQERSDMDSKVWPIGYPHEPPDRPMSVRDAQMTMQRHRACRVGECPRKTAAWRVLVESGRITPDSGRTY
ncbi:hypothetical protein ACFXNW_20755 [Nocardia sp. NPDC059180]|uniref:hypothetical protein n=1 Tax=Nocardia sp. NPDC059180 TaxID=3346761 RepID=UPI0036A64DCF